MDVIPLQADMVRGSHGAIPASKQHWPIIIGGTNAPEVSATDVFYIIKQTVTG
jgi:hypothetical protein